MSSFGLGRAVVGAALLAGGIAGFRLAADASPHPPVAVIYDQISLDDPRDDFSRRSRSLLVDAGYRVQHIGPRQASVRHFAELPRSAPSLLILRTHAALVVENGQWTPEVALFTAEPVDASHEPTNDGQTWEIETRQQAKPWPGASGGPSREEILALIPVRRTSGHDRRPMYGIGARYVREHMIGRFDDTIVMLMGCDGMRGRAISEAFLARGARAVVGWSTEVSAAHTDHATLSFVRAVAKGASVADAVRFAMLHAGPDPTSGAYLIAAVR